MRIEQALHGYSDGHRLLAASVDLPRDATHAMLGLTDLSGRNIVKGFEEYLTGYPVPGTEYFAFGKTWYAPEMERPGCVWTHTLLLRQGDLGTARRLSSLRDLFRQPSGRRSFADYEAPLSWVREDGDTAPAASQREVAAAVLSGLYLSPDVPVLLPASESNIFEALVLEVWYQQWPSLRAGFRFTTGAIAARSVSGRGFDLQVVPTATIREVRRETPLATLVSLPSPRGKQEESEWLPVAVADLYGEDSYRFRSFLRKAAENIRGGREMFSPFAELFAFAPLLAEERRPLQDLIELVGKRYPAANQARRLKRALFGFPAPLAAVISSGESEVAILGALATSSHPEAFDADELGLEDRGRVLWTESREEALGLMAQLARTDHSALGERLLFALAQGLAAEDVVKFIESVPALAATVVRLNPHAAALPEIWLGLPERQRSLFDAATAGKETPPDLQRGIVLAMLQAKSDAVADGVFKRFGPIAVTAVLDWFDGSPLGTPSQLGARWRRVLAEHPARMIDWLISATEPREATVALVADLLNPHTRDVQCGGVSPWLKPFRRAGPLDEAARVRLRAFLLALGFDNPGPGSDEVVVQSFATVHEALAKDRLDYDSWGWLEDQVPTLSWLRNWDRCERLRRGLVERFSRYGWPARQFVRCAADKNMFRDLLESCWKAEGGKGLLRRLEDSLSAGEFQSDGEFRRILKKHV